MRPKILKVPEGDRIFLKHTYNKTQSKMWLMHQIKANKFAWIHVGKRHTDTPDRQYIETYSTQLDIIWTRSDFGPGLGFWVQHNSPLWQLSFICAISVVKSVDRGFCAFLHLLYSSYLNALNSKWNKIPLRTGDGRFFRSRYLSILPHKPKSTCMAWHRLA